MRTDAPDLDPVDDGRSSHPFATVLCPALQTALQEVAAAWAPEWIPRSEGGTPIGPVLMRLAMRLDRMGDGDGAYENGGGEETLEQADALLLAAIRRSLLKQWRRGNIFVDQDRVLALLHSIDLLAEEPVLGGPDDSEPQLTETEAFGLVAEVAHDLRSPLTSILFLSEALRNEQSGSLTELQKHQLGLIYAAALVLAGFPNDLMTIAHEQTSGHLDEAVAFSLH